MFVLVAVLPFALLALLVNSAWSPLVHLDRSTDATLHRHAVGAPRFVDFLDGISTVGAPSVFRAVVAVVALLLVRRAPRLALWMIVTMAGEALLNGWLKALVGRLRPHFTDPVAMAAGKAFPSGHAMASFVGVVVLLGALLPLLPRRARGPTVAVGVLVVLVVGFSRIGLGVHYPSDVVGGWLAGAAWLAVTGAAVLMWGRAVQRSVRR